MIPSRACIAVQGVHVSHLELRTISAGSRGDLDQPLGRIETSVVVYPNLGNKKYRRTRVHLSMFDPHFMSSRSSDRDKTAELIQEGNELDARTKKDLDLLGTGSEASGYERLVRNLYGTTRK